MKYYNQQELGKRIRHKVFEKASRYEDRKQEKDKSTKRNLFWKNWKRNRRISENCVSWWFWD